MDAHTLLLLAILAAYRLAYDASRMDGPFELYTRLRGWLVARLGAGHWLAVGADCPICVSFWTALPAAAAWAYLSGAPITHGLLAWPAIAGAVLLILKGTQQR